VTQLHWFTAKKLAMPDTDGAKAFVSGGTLTPTRHQQVA
jgi:hypothetical protein